MAEVEFTIDDMVNTAANKKPNEFNAMFDAAMAQIRLIRLGRM